ncbi:M23 family metallopeptidase [Actinospica acidiphila]|uniref:M23 family metallopeptidase n=1 Tax=Streptomyces tunisiensis TaxID=948699 RepID=A0ABP7XLU4_9ACTN|nr:MULTISPECIES: M23 family metallopeptidase [unclassified Streptomyces]AXI87546.1 M23 family peptidase [Streptomyces sp. ETH9427]MQL66699.1 M23 family metallopeptidase [Streptomyces vinaceus]MUT89311.1 peptidoglycan DD-metalloendopeptidase family protein [Streptomyces sp. Z38]NEA79787.1 M23 family metallopeptidase [Actinospica acidiphila]WPW20101.1 M23 family metallopeptidase [Streptomyces griseoincarnatus]
MASNPPAPEAPFRPNDTFAYGAPGADEGPFEEWNPTAESVRPVRGRHRVAKQRGGGLARSSTVLGVGVIAAVGAGGMASAQTGKPPVSISMPDLPNVGSLISDEETPKGSSTPLSDIGRMAAADTGAEEGADAGEALRARIMAQVEQQQGQAQSKAQAAALAAAEKEAAEAAAKAEKEAKEKAEAAKKKAEEEAAKKAEAERLAELAKQYALPTSSYTVTSTFGQAGAYWSSGYHTGLDFAAPTGTLIKAVHTGTITSAGWDGSYGYKTVLTLDDGTEVWYAHQSSINVSVGQKVATGDVIGRVGATGNVTGAHLHLEVHTGSGSVDPAAWLAGKGLSI